MAKKIIGYLVIILLVLGTVGCIYFGIEYISYNDYKSNASSLNSQIESLKTEKEELLNEKSQLQLQIVANEENISSLTIQLEESEADKELLNAQISSLQAENVTLNETIVSLNSQIVTLNNNIISLQQELEELSDENDGYVSQISSLQAEIVTLNNEILDLEAQLEVYENMTIEDYYKIQFIDDSDDSIVYITYLPENSDLTYIPSVNNTEDTSFYGWATTEEATISNLYNFIDYVVTADATFYSVLGNCVNLVINENYLFDTLSSNSVSNNDFYRVGSELKINDVVKVDEDVLNDDNVALSIYNTNNQVLSLDSLITELPYRSVSALYLSNNGETGEFLTYAYYLEIKADYLYKESGNYSINNTSGSDFAGLTNNERVGLAYKYFTLNDFDFSFDVKVSSDDSYIHLTSDSYDFVRSDNSGTRIKTAYVFDLNDEYGFAVQLDFHYDSSGFLYFMPYEAKESESSDSIAVKNIEFTIHLRDFITRSTSLVHADYLDYLEVKV